MSADTLRKGVDYIGVAVVYICFDDKGEFVMAKRSAQARDDRGVWDIGGGGVEFSDTVEDTLRKEIKEEYCADVLSFEPLGYRDVHRVHDGQPTHWIALDFKVKVDRSQVKIGEPHKFDDIGWFTLDTKPTELHSQLPTFFAKYSAKL